LHVAEFSLYNSYIPQEYRRIIKDYYVVESSPSTLLPTSGLNNQFAEDKVSNSRFNLKFNYLINDDIGISMSSQFGNITNLPGLTFLGNVNSLNKSAANLRKGDNANIQNINNLLNYSIWQKTDPLTITLSIILYAKTDPLIDVIIPAYTLMSHCIIDYNKEDAGGEVSDVFSFPGISAFEALNIGRIREGLTADKNTADVSFDGNFTSKLMSLYIKGLVNVDLAMIKNITPVFSKHTAKSKYDPEKYTGDYPISADLTLQIESLTPADSNMLWEGALSPIKSRFSKSYYKNKTSAESSSAGEFSDFASGR